MRCIIALGSGFAGMQAVVDLELLFRNAPDYETLFISDQNYALFTPPSYRCVSQGMIVSLGAHDAVVSVGGIQFHGGFAWLFWNAVHLYKLVNLKKQFQAAVDWSLGTIFPRDAALFRRLGACKLYAAESESAPPSNPRSRSAP